MSKLYSKYSYHRLIETCKAYIAEYEAAEVKKLSQALRISMLQDVIATKHRERCLKSEEDRAVLDWKPGK